MYCTKHPVQRLYYFKSDLRIAVQFLFRVVADCFGKFDLMNVSNKYIFYNIIKYIQLNMIFKSRFTWFTWKGGGGDDLINVSPYLQKIVSQLVRALAK